MRSIGVYDLVHYLKNSLDNDPRIQNISVSGEISNFNHHFSGHFYFSIKDDRARLSCVMFRSYASKVSFVPKNGDKVIIRCNISVFEGTGQMQAYVLDMRPDGLGDLYLRFEALKKKLNAEGYFADNHKKAKPEYVQKVAVLVGDKSAALSDIRTCFQRRWPICSVDVYPVLVQGEGSSEDIITKLLAVDQLGYEAIILARGGGSIEDLWSFNDERLAKVIYELDTFIVTGIGHEQDYTIADFVADLRAPTPTAAVELITPDIGDVISRIENNMGKLTKDINKKYKDTVRTLGYIQDSVIFRDPYYIIHKDAQMFDDLSYRLFDHTKMIKSLRTDLEKGDQTSYYAIKRMIEKRKSKVDYGIISAKQSLLSTVAAAAERIINRTAFISRDLKGCFKEKAQHFMRYDTLLKAYGYRNTLKRGFSVVKKDGKVVKSINSIFVGDIIGIDLFEGHITAEIKEKNDG